MPKVYMHTVGLYIEKIEEYVNLVQELNKNSFRCQDQIVEMASTADDDEVAEAIDALLEDEHMEALADAYEDEDFNNRDEIPDDELDKFLMEYNGEDIPDDSPPTTTTGASQVNIYKL